MGSGTFYPVVSGDDGHWAFTGEVWSNSANYMYFGGGLSSYLYKAFIRFPNVTIPYRSIITSAFLRTKAYTGGSGTVNAEIYLNKTPTPIAPTNVSEANALVLTTAKSTWTVTDTWSSPNEYDSPTIVDVLQEVVNLSGFASENALMMIISGTSTTNNKRAPSSVEDSAAELHVEWGSAPSLGEVATWNPYDAGSNLNFSEDLLTATHA